MSRPSTLRPARALVHPVWWIALALLIANDHVFKGSGLLPAAVTGKLSDFVGLLVAPVLLASLLRTRTALGFGLAHLAVALGFAAINLSPSVAGAVVVATAATPFPWDIVVDPTDLIALPMVALSYTLFLPWIGQRAPVRRVVGRAGFGLGMLACVATSPPPGPPIEPGPTQPGEPIPGSLIFPTEDAALMIANRTGTAQIVRLRALLDEVEVDCNQIALDPSGLLDRGWFAPAVLWSVEPDRAIPVHNQGQCSAYLVDGPELPMQLIWFSSNSFPTRQITTEGSAVPGGLRIDIELPEGTAAWGSHTALMAPPPRVREPVEPACQTVPEGFGVEWTAIPVGRRIIGRLETAPDGCTAIDFEPQDERTAPVRWFVCLPPVALPFAEGDAVELKHLITGAGGALSGAEMIGPAGRLLISRGVTVPEGIDVASVSARDSGCAPTIGCGASAPVSVQLNHVEGPATPVSLGEPIAVGRGELTIVRAERRLVIDRRCDDPGVALGSGVVESIYIETF